MQKGRKGRWLTRRSLSAHLTVLIVAPGCLYAGWWQATVALSGNDLSYLYAIEWPFFAVFAVVVWWNIVHDDPETVGARGLRKATSEAAGSAPGGSQDLGPAHEPPGGPDQLPADRPRSPALATRRQAPSRRRREEEDEHLAAYNDYLASVAGESGSKTWRRPWRPPPEDEHSVAGRPDRGG